jgi:hypothetical protein
MQTFLPYPSFKRSAKVLDYRRLGKQRVETKQIYLALTVPTYGWKHHAAVKMWKGYEKALLRYGLIICQEWTRRGYNDTLTEWFKLQLTKHPERTKYPPWLGSRAFHRSHKSKLVWKDKGYYRKYFPHVPSNLPYEWNKSENDNGNDINQSTVAVNRRTVL